MKERLAIRLAACLLMLAAAAHADPAREAAAAGQSLQALDVMLEPASGPGLHIGDFAGHPVVVTLFYSRCLFVCPAITLSMQRLEAAIGPADRDRVRFLMVSLDDQNDTPPVLAQFAEEHHLPAPRWTVAHASARDVRLLAAALGIRYRRLPDGSYSHSSVITVLDSSGTPQARSSDLAGSDPALVAALQAALR